MTISNKEMADDALQAIETLFEWLEAKIEADADAEYKFGAASRAFNDLNNLQWLVEDSMPDLDDDD